MKCYISQETTEGDIRTGMDADSRMIRKMKNGDEAAMEAFVRKYYPDILRYCRCHVPDFAAAQDLTQETFARFFGALSGYRHMGKALPYLYVTARHLCADHYAKSREMAASDLSAFEEPIAGGPRGAPEDAVLRTDVRRALDELPEELREVVILYYFQELKLREIAPLLGIGLPLVKYRMSRAKELLRTLLRE